MGQGGAEKIVYQLCRDNSDQEQIVVSCGGVYADKLESESSRMVFKFSLMIYILPFNDW